VHEFQQIVEDALAGDPQNEQVKWIGLHPGQLCDRMARRGCPISRYLVTRLLALFRLKKRRYSKTQCLGRRGDRDAQFGKIAVLKDAFISRGLPVLSIDTKKKELLGNFDRGETYYGRGSRQVNDHDFLSYADGVVVPHGIYDVAQNRGYLTLGVSKDTSEFVCDNLLWYWQQELQWQYPQAESILLLCDSGGSNSCRHHIVKHDLYSLAQQLQMNILVAHYPAYCSKWNPIEHRLFCHLHRAWKGSIFHDIHTVKELALETSTKTGLRVNVRINSKTYATGRKVPEDFKKRLNELIAFDDHIAQWNYLIRAT
jgi:hypothetical protein